MVLLLSFVALALGVSFLCSVLESVLLSITPGHVSLLEQQKHPASGRLRAWIGVFSAVYTLLVC